MLHAVRRLQFCSGHRVFQHESKCANPHGHNYVIFIHALAPELDSIGRVIDFSVLKEKLGAWIDQNWDHTFICYEKDEQMINACKSVDRNKDIYIMKKNPTAENMAEHLLNDICPLLFQNLDITITKIVLWETENCYVEVVL